MKSNKTKELTTVAILTAVSVVLGRAFLIPTPTGLLTLLDAGIYFTAFSIGGRQAGLVGALSGFLIDLLSGYPQWMFFSLIAHGSQGFLAGTFEKNYRIIGLVCATLAMVGIYFISSLVLGYGMASSIAAVSDNIGQNFLGMVVGYILSLVFKVVKR